MTAGGAALRHVIMLECASQTLAHSRMVPPATTNKITPQSHQSFLSPNLLIANKTALESGGSAAKRPGATWARRVDFLRQSADIAGACPLARAQVIRFP